MKKIVSLMLVVIIFLAACSSASEGPAEIRVSTWAGGTELEEFQAIVDELNEENADEYEITIESIPSDYAIKVQTQASAGQAADLIWISQEAIASYASEGVLMELDDYLADSDLSQYSFNENLLEATKYEDSQYAVPWIANPLIMYYNKNVVSAEDQARLEQTNDGQYLTWEEFTQMAAKYHNPDEEKYGVLVNGWPPLEYFMWSYGGELEDEEGNLTVDTDEAKKGIEQLYDITVQNPITPNKDAIDAIGYTETFQKGNTAFFFGGVADGVEKIGGTDPVGFEVGYAVVPGSGDYTSTFNYSASLGLTTDSKNPDVAYAALEDLTAKIFDWKVVPPVDITELGYESYEDYISQVNESKTGMGKTIEQSMEISHETTYTAKSATNAGIGYEEIYYTILSAAVSDQEIDIEQLIENAMNRQSEE